MFGEGIGLADLILLLNAVKSKELQLEVKILDKPWQPIDINVIKAMVRTIQQERVVGTDDIRLRLHGKVASIKES
jgi:hypothetical protein